MARHFLLLALLLAHTALLSADEMQNSGEDGSGYGSGVPPTERCNHPDPRPEPLGGSIDTAGDLEPRCHLACIEKIFMQEERDLEVSTTYPVWPMIPDSVIEENCTIQKMVEMCRESCALITIVQCQSKCTSETCDPSNSSACQICRRDACDIGCEVKLELEAIDEEGSHADALPPAPIAPLDLTIADSPHNNSAHISDAGLYTMNISRAVPPETNSSAIRHPTIIILRVSRRKQKYIWVTSFNKTLNLTAYACEEVRIQLGAINKFGIREHNFASPTSLSVAVYGESPPTCAAHPNNVNIELENVNMTGYWKHANVIVHWKRRKKGFELLDNYEARFELERPKEQHHCKPTRLTHTVSKTAVNDLRWNISAQAPGDGPISNCHYTVTIEAVSVDGSECQYPPDVHRVHISSSDTTPVPLNPRWSQEWDDKSGNFTYKLDWSLPDDTNVRRAVGSFEVLVKLIAPDNTEDTLSSTFYFTNENSGLDYHHTQSIKYDEKNFKHQIVLRSHPGDRSLAVFVPAPRRHTFSAEAVPPVQVVSVTAKLIKQITELKTKSVTLDFAVAWDEVETEVAYYQLKVARDNKTVSAATHELQLTEPRATISGLTVPLDNSRPCLYIQVKAVSQFMAEGPWSDAVCLELPHSVPTTGTLPPTLEGGQSSSSGSDNREVVYSVVAVIIVLVVCVVVLFVIIFFALYPTLRNKKQKRIRRLNTVFIRKTSEKDKYMAGKLDQWEVYSNQVVIQHLLGEGAFGEVFRGLFDSTITEKSSVKKFDESNSVVVAVKQLKDDATYKDRQIFLKHILQAKKVAQYQHPNLVCLVGCVTEMEPLSLLTEYPEQGDLLAYLRTQRMEIYQSKLQMLDYQNRAGGNNKLSHKASQQSSQQSLQAQDLMLFASHVAAGLEHLACIGVVHGDVACRNLFLTADKVVKIADFGLDSVSEEEKGLVYMKGELGRLPIRWMAIESIRDGEFSTSSDVWSFGVTLWEIASLGGFPYHDTANSDILATLGAGQRLQCPTNCSEEIYGIMLKCCAAFPGDRPSFSTLHHVFRSLHTTANDGQYITLNVDPNSPYYLASPRNSMVIEPVSLSVADDCTPLMGAGESIEVEIVPTIPTAPERFAAESTEISHFHSASYSYSDAGGLPCITEEGEDVDNEDEEEREDEEGEKRDSSNDSTYSHESVKFRKLSDKEDSEESLIASGVTTIEYV